jgi:hypothetical protein
LSLKHFHPSLIFAGKAGAYPSSLDLDGRGKDTFIIVNAPGVIPAKLVTKVTRI